MSAVRLRLAALFVFAALTQCHLASGEQQLQQQRESQARRHRVVRAPYGDSEREGKGEREGDGDRRGKFRERDDAADSLPAPAPAAPRVYDFSDSDWRRNALQSLGNALVPGLSAHRIGNARIPSAVEGGDHRRHSLRSHKHKHRNGAERSRRKGGGALHFHSARDEEEEAGEGYHRLSDRGGVRNQRGSGESERNSSVFEKRQNVLSVSVPSAVEEASRRYSSTPHRFEESKLKSRKSDTERARSEEDENEESGSGSDTEDTLHQSAKRRESTEQHQQDVLSVLERLARDRREQETETETEGKHRSHHHDHRRRYEGDRKSSSSHHSKMAKREEEDGERAQEDSPSSTPSHHRHSHQHSHHTHKKHHHHHHNHHHSSEDHPSHSDRHLLSKEDTPLSNEEIESEARNVLATLKAEEKANATRTKLKDREDEEERRNVSSSLLSSSETDNIPLPSNQTNSTDNFLDRRNEIPTTSYFHSNKTSSPSPSSSPLPPAPNANNTRLLRGAMPSSLQSSDNHQGLLPSSFTSKESTEKDSDEKETEKESDKEKEKEKEGTSDGSDKEGDNKAEGEGEGDSEGADSASSNSASDQMEEGEGGHHKEESQKLEQGERGASETVSRDAEWVEQKTNEAKEAMTQYNAARKKLQDAQQTRDDDEAALASAQKKLTRAAFAAEEALAKFNTTKNKFEETVKHESEEVQRIVEMRISASVIPPPAVPNPDDAKKSSSLSILGGDEDNKDKKEKEDGEAEGENKQKETHATTSGENDEPCPYMCDKNYCQKTFKTAEDSLLGCWRANKDGEVECYPFKDRQSFQCDDEYGTKPCAAASLDVVDNNSFSFVTATNESKEKHRGSNSVQVFGKNFSKCMKLNFIDEGKRCEDVENLVPHVHKDKKYHPEDVAFQGKMDAPILSENPTNKGTQQALFDQFLPRKPGTYEVCWVQFLEGEKTEIIGVQHVGTAMVLKDPLEEKEDKEKEKENADKKEGEEGENGEEGEGGSNEDGKSEKDAKAHDKGHEHKGHKKSSNSVLAQAPSRGLLFILLPLLTLLRNNALF